MGLNASLPMPYHDQGPRRSASRCVHLLRLVNSMATELINGIVLGTGSSSPLRKFTGVAMLSNAHDNSLANRGSLYVFKYSVKRVNRNNDLRIAGFAANALRRNHSEKYFRQC